MRHTIAALVVVTSSGCTLRGLGDDLDQASCRDKLPSFCDELNESEPSGDPCIRWSCAPDTEVCTLLPRDLDHDGAPDEECVGSNIAFDCDDNDATRAPSLAEVCDGIDNDCDDELDEGALVATGPVRTIVTTSPVQHVSVAVSTDGTAAALFVPDTGATTSGTLHEASVDDWLQSDDANAMLVSYDMAAGQEQSAEGTAAIRINRGMAQPYTLVAFAQPQGGGTIRIGSYVATPSPLLAAPTEPLADSSDASAVRLAPSTDGNSALAAFLKRKPSLTDSCSTDANADVAVNVVALDDASPDPDVPNPGDALTLGSTTDVSPPAAVALDATSYLVAIVNRADESKRGKEIVLYRVTATNPPTATIVLRETTADTTGELSLVRGGNTQMTQRIALSYRVGCGSTAQVSFLVLSWSSTGELLTASEPIVAPKQASTNQQRRPTALWSSVPAEAWFWAWEEGQNEVRGIQVTPAGVRLGDAVYSVFGEQSGVIRQGVTLGVGQDGRGVRVVAHIATSAGNGIWSEHLSCTASE